VARDDSAEYVGAVYYPRAGQACVSPHCPARGSGCGCAGVDPLADMLKGMSVAEEDEDPLEPFRRTFFSCNGHVYHTE
jgi:hypothetical protein